MIIKFKKMIAFKDGEMKNRAFTLLLLGLLSMMGLSGTACRRSDTPEVPAATTGEALKIAESDYKPAGQAGDTNSIVDPGASAEKADLRPAKRSGVIIPSNQEMKSASAE